MQSINKFDALSSQDAASTALKKPVLKRGVRDRAVIELQQLLAHWGYYATPFDDIFDIPVENAVKSYQNRVFLLEDGIVGAKTWQALFTGAPVDMPELREGSTGSAVKTLQRLLQLRVDGIFGAKTKAALITFQRDRKLLADGIVGAKTWYELSKIPH